MSVLSSCSVWCRHAKAFSRAADSSWAVVLAAAAAAASGAAAGLGGCYVWADE